MYNKWRPLQQLQKFVVDDEKQCQWNQKMHFGNVETSANLSALQDPFAAQSIYSNTQDITKHCKEKYKTAKASIPRAIIPQ